MSPLRWFRARLITWLGIDTVGAHIVSDIETEDVEPVTIPDLAVYMQRPSIYDDLLNEGIRDAVEMRAAAVGDADFTAWTCENGWVS